MLADRGRRRKCKHSKGSAKIRPDRKGQRQSTTTVDGGKVGLGLDPEGLEPV